MFTRLQQKWKVNGWQFGRIMIVFAITGTLTAWISKTITGWLGLGPASFWLWKLLLRLGVLVFGYQAILLCIAFLLGEFAFFWQYERKILRWFGIGRPKKDPPLNVK
jgi:hypothetical protein